MLIHIFLFWKYTNFLSICIWKTYWNEDLTSCVENLSDNCNTFFECHVHLNILSFSSAPCFLISNCPLYKINHFGLTSGIVPSDAWLSVQDTNFKIQSQSKISMCGILWHCLLRLYEIKITAPYCAQARYASSTPARLEEVCFGTAQLLMHEHKHGWATWTWHISDATISHLTAFWLLIILPASPPPTMWKSADKPIMWTWYVNLRHIWPADTSTLKPYIQATELHCH